MVRQMKGEYIYIYFYVRNHLPVVLDRVFRATREEPGDFGPLIADLAAQSSAITFRS
jgi:hypothetical protein